MNHRILGEHLATQERQVYEVDIYDWEQGYSKGPTIECTAIVPLVAADRVKHTTWECEARRGRGTGSCVMRQASE